MNLHSEGIDVTLAKEAVERGKDRKRKMRQYWPCGHIRTMETTRHRKVGGNDCLVCARQQSLKSNETPPCLLAEAWGPL